MNSLQAAGAHKKPDAERFRVSWGRGMRALIIMLGFFMLLPGAAFAEAVPSWGYMKKDGTYMESQRRSMPMLPSRNDNTPAQRDAKPPAGRQEKKRIDPYDSQYNNNYRPKY